MARREGGWACVDPAGAGTYAAGIMDSFHATGAWRVVKTYGHEEGLSCCFRQWQAAHSHCRFLHGYALAFRFTFICESLDDRGWCIDFGGLKPLRAWLHEMFDHTLLAAADDPALQTWLGLQAAGLAQLRVVANVGCEAFALEAQRWAAGFVEKHTGGRVRVEQVEVSEHAANAASFMP